MNRDDIEKLRARLMAPPEGASPSPHCPPGDRYLQAVLGELTTSENSSLADHAAACPVCTVAWRLAREYVEEAELPGTREARASRRWWVVAAATAAAALIAFVLVVPIRQEDPSPTPSFRTGHEDAIRSLTPEDRPLPRDAVVLRWTAGLEGSRYDVRVTDQHLVHVTSAQALEETELTVSADLLSDLAPGSILLWQVEEVLPDGRRIPSDTFIVQVD